jgi:anti-anti-sigma factor
MHNGWPSLRITLCQYEQQLHLKIDGDIDTDTERWFDDAIRAAVGRGPHLIINLTAVEILDSAGVAILFNYLEQIAVVIVNSATITARALEFAAYPKMTTEAA